MTQTFSIPADTEARLRMLLEMLRSENDETVPDQRGAPAEHARSQSSRANPTVVAARY